MSLAGFLIKYADEALAVGSALNTVLEGLALSPAQSAKVRETIAKLEAAHESITEVLKTEPEKTVIKINQKGIDAAVSRVLPKLVEEAVAKATAPKANA
jgi:predicted naringenin-chalcone synthase